MFVSSHLYTLRLEQWWMGNPRHNLYVALIFLSVHSSSLEIAVGVSRLLLQKGA